MAKEGDMDYSILYTSLTYLVVNVATLIITNLPLFLGLGGGIYLPNVTNNYNRAFIHGGNIENNYAPKGCAIYLGNNDLTIGGSLLIPGGTGTVKQSIAVNGYTIKILDDFTKATSSNPIYITPNVYDGNTGYNTSSQVIKLATDATISSLESVISKFQITPLVQSSTGKTTFWTIDASTGKPVMNTSAGISASLDTGVEDIVVKKNSTVLQEGQLIENQTGSFTLSLASVAGQSVSGDSSIQCFWLFDGEMMQPPKIGKNGFIEIPGSVPDGVEFISTTSITITCTSTSDPTIAPGLHDIILIVDDETDTYSFWLQIKK